MSETLAYVIIVVAAFLCSCQFLFQRAYNKTEGSGIYAAMVLLFISSVIKIVSTLVIYGFDYVFSGWAALFAFLTSLNTLLLTLFSAKVFLVANMSVYSLFMMLGGMALPFAFGIMSGEGWSIPKVLCFALILVAMLITTDFKSKSSRTAIKYYIAIFITNGLSGVFAASNNLLGGEASVGAYVLLTGVCSIVMSAIAVGAVLLRTKRKPLVAPQNALISSVGYGIISSTSALFIVIALIRLDASVQYPMITGGTIVFSTIICLVRREKLTLRDIIAAMVAAGASVVVVL